MTKSPCNNSSRSSRQKLSLAAVFSATIVGVVGLTGCDGTGPLSLSGGPAVSLSATQQSGPAPLSTTFTATVTGNAPLQIRFDFDGDGAFDTDLSDVFEVSHIFEVAGSFASVVEVVDATGNTATASLTPPILVQPGLADLDVDTDRNGEINDADEVGEDLFTAERGAAVLANVDDDDGDGERDILDAQVDGESDLLDMAQLRVARSLAIQASDDVTLRIEPASAHDRIRIFERTDDNGFRVLFSPADSDPILDASQLAASDMNLYVEVIGRGATWDGTLHITLEVARDGEVIASDAVRIESAPIVFPHNVEDAEVLYLMEVLSAQNGPNFPFFDKVRSTIPSDVELYTVNENAYFGDRWVQDNMQAGVQSVPTSDGLRSVVSFLETERYSGGYGLENLVPDGLLAADFGFSYPGGDTTSLNYGGNLEVSPPYSGPNGDYPLGRIMAGGGAGGTILGRPYTDSMASDQVAWMDAQRIQGPTLMLSSEWLAVGHLDEYFLFVADTRSVADGGREDHPWRIVVASPDLAVELLEGVLAEGGGSTSVFEGRQTETTVNAILEDIDLLAYNDSVQARIDSVMDVLTTEIGLTEDDFIYVPVMYEAYVEQGFDFSLALNPGIQNLVAVGSKDKAGVFYVPDPEGPRNAGGVDVWAQHTLDVLNPLGHQVELVDVFNSYHLLWGEAHCGTNIQRATPQTRWWNHTDADNRGRP